MKRQESGLVTNKRDELVDTVSNVQALVYLGIPLNEIWGYKRVLYWNPNDYGTYVFCTSDGMVFAKQNKKVR